MLAVGQGQGLSKSIPIDRPFVYPKVKAFHAEEGRCFCVCYSHSVTSCSTPSSSVLLSSPLRRLICARDRYRALSFGATRREKARNQCRQGTPGRRGASPKFPPIFGAKKAMTLSFLGGPLPAFPPVGYFPTNSTNQPLRFFFAIWVDQPVLHRLPPSRANKTSIQQRNSLPRRRHPTYPFPPTHTTHIMAAFIKAANAKIRSNPVSDYVCSTRTYSFCPALLCSSEIYDSSARRTRKVRTATTILSPASRPSTLTTQWDATMRKRREHNGKGFLGGEGGGVETRRRRGRTVAPPPKTGAPPFLPRLLADKVAVCLYVSADI